MAETRWDPSQPDRRANPRVEYRRTPPARLDLAGQACAVRNLNPNGLRIEPAPPRRPWSPCQAVSGVLYLRTSRPMPVAGRVLRVGAMGLVIVPDGSGAWPASAAIETERDDLQRVQRERRSDPRIPIPPRIPLPMFLPRGVRPSLLRDLSASGLCYVLSPGERAPVMGSTIEGEVRLDPEIAINIRGRVVRCTGREIAVAVDPPGLGYDILEHLRRRLMGSSSTAL